MSHCYSLRSPAIEVFDCRTTTYGLVEGQCSLKDEAVIGKGVGDKFETIMKHHNTCSSWSNADSSSWSCPNEDQYLHHRCLAAQVENREYLRRTITKLINSANSEATGGLVLGLQVSRM